MKHLLLSVFLILSCSSWADEYPELQAFTRSFLEDFGDKSKRASDTAKAYFAATPVFYIGEMPGFSDSPEVA